MTIKTVARRNWPGSAGDEPTGSATPPGTSRSTRPEQIRAAVSWVLAHDEMTGFATPGDVRLLGMVCAAEGDRLPAEEAERLLAQVEGYSSPFLRMPA